MEELIVYSIVPTDEFDDNVKFYIKKRKFTKLYADIKDIINNLKKGILQGTIIPELEFPDNKIVYKVRAGNSNTNVGKSNGYRVVYMFQKDDNIIFLITIYYKKDDNRMPTNEDIKYIIKKYCI